MASAYSILHNYSQELYKPNLELISTALQSKQGALNANRMKLQSMYDQLGFLDIAKEDDKEYTEQRLQTAKGIVDKYAALDLSDSNLTNGLVTKLTDIVDETVQTAAVSTARLRGEQRAWSELKKTKPELYSQTNHAYANRASGAWLNDGEVGSAYNGGGGVIEYRDLGKKVLENLPDLQKSLNAKWIEAGPGGGYFQAILTGEKVGRQELNKALDFVFDADDQGQMNIDAWAKYDSLDDAQLKEAYDGHFQPRVIDLQERISATEVLRSKASGTAKKAEFDTQIEGMKEDQRYLQSRSFENVVKSGGREAAYSTLHTRQYKDNILDTYSYNRILSRDVDKVAVANANYQLRLDALEIDRAELALKASEAQGMADAGLRADGSSIGADRGAQVTVPTKETEIDFIVKEQAREKKIHLDMSNVMWHHGLSNEQLSDPKFLEQLNNLSGQTVITLKDKNGKEREINIAENLTLLENFKYNIVQVSPVKQRQFDAMGKMIEKAQTHLSRAARHGGDVKLSEEVPNFNFRLSKDANGTYKHSHIDRKDKKTGAINNNYRWLLKNPPKTEAGKLTLDIYTALHLMNDGGITASERHLARGYVKSLVADLPASARARINTDDIVIGKGKRVKNSYSFVNKAGDFWLSEFTKGDTEYKQAEVGHRLRQRDGVERPEYEGSYGQGSAQLAISGDKAYAAKKLGYNIGVDRVLKRGFDDINRVSSDVYAATKENLESSYEYVFDKKDAGYDILRNKAGILEDNFKDKITISKKFNDDGTDSGQVWVSYRVKNTAAITTATKEEYKYIRKEVSQKSLISSGVVDKFDTKRFTYNASQGKHARTVSLGNHQYTDDHPLSTTNDFPNPVMTPEFMATHRERAKNLYGDDGQRYQYAMSLFKQGQYDFNMIPNSTGTYSVQISLNGTKKKAFDTGIQKMTDDQRYDLHVDPRNMIEIAFTKYLDHIESEVIEEIAQK